MSYGVYKDEEKQRKKGSGESKEAADTESVAVAAKMTDIRGFNKLIDKKRR